MHTGVGGVVGGGGGASEPWLSWDPTFYHLPTFPGQVLGLPLPLPIPKLFILLSPLLPVSSQGRDWLTSEYQAHLCPTIALRLDAGAGRVEMGETSPLASSARALQPDLCSRLAGPQGLLGGLWAGVSLSPAPIQAPRMSWQVSFLASRPSAPVCCGVL